MKAVALLLACSLVGCATAPPPVPKTFIELERRPEVRALPPNPRDEKLAGEFSEKEWVEPAEKGQLVPKAGMLVSESRMARDILFRTRYDELRKTCEADRMVFGSHRDYYEERLNLADEEIKRLQPTWWDQNKTTVAFIAGSLVGFGITLGITKAVYGASQ